MGAALLDGSGSARSVHLARRRHGIPSLRSRGGLADRAPTPDQVGIEIPGEPRRRRPARLAVLVSVTATVVAALAVPVVLGRGTAEAPVQANDTWHYSFDVDLPAGFVIVRSRDHA